MQSLRLKPRRMVDTMLDHPLVKIAERKTVQREGDETMLRQPGGEIGQPSRLEQFPGRGRRHPQPDPHGTVGSKAFFHGQAMATQIGRQSVEITPGMDVRAVC